MNITLKQTRLRHVPKTKYNKPIVIKNQLKQFYSKVKQYSLDDIICIDETSLNSLMIRIKCYEELGKIPSTRKRKPPKKLDQVGVLNVQRCKNQKRFL